MKLTQWLNKKSVSKENMYINIVRNSQWFDERWYLKQYDDVFRKLKDPARHYYLLGWKENRNPSAEFKTAEYLKMHPECKVCPLVFEQNRNQGFGADKENKQNTKNAVAVIVPTYNRRNYLPKAMNMLKAQTLHNIKYIIVDDGSTDGSIEYIEDSIKDDNRFILLRNFKNQGPSSARNKALSIVDSEYVGFFDIDDEIPSDYYAKLYNQAIQTYADIVFTNYNNEKHKIGVVRTEGDKYRVLRNGAIWDKLYETTLLKNNKIRFADHLYTADNLFNIEAFHRAQKILLVQEPRYLYKLHDDSIGKDEKLVTKRKKDIVSICCKAVTYAKKHHFNASMRAYLHNYLLRSYNCYPGDKVFHQKISSVLSKLKIRISFSDALRVDVKKSKLIAQSEYFDKRYYRLHNPDLWFSSKDMSEHYLTTGWIEGRNPSREFDGNKYLERYSDVARFGVNPLVHYIEHGRGENRKVSPVESFLGKIKYALEYPVRVKEEYDHLVAEIKSLETMK